MEFEYEGAQMIRAVMPGMRKKVFKLTPYGDKARFSDKDARTEEAQFIARLLSQIQNSLELVKAVQTIQGIRP